MIEREAKKKKIESDDHIHTKNEEKKKESDQTVLMTGWTGKS